MTLDRYVVRPAYSDDETLVGWDLLLIGHDVTGGEIVTWANRFPTRRMTRDAAREMNSSLTAVITAALHHL
jgi:hypothetical protein